MFKKIIKNYYKLFDEKLENWTIVVLLIAALIVWVSLLTKNTDATLTSKVNILEIEWIKYKVNFVEIKK